MLWNCVKQGIEGTEVYTNVHDLSEMLKSIVLKATPLQQREASELRCIMNSMHPNQLELLYEYWTIEQPDVKFNAEKLRDPLKEKKLSYFRDFFYSLWIIQFPCFSLDFHQLRSQNCYKS